MPRITDDTFDPMRSYISVRLLQGVPLVDADWNEAHDIRKFEVQAFLKWFVGNGVPEGNDGFHIAGLGPDVGDDVRVRDFVIQRGVSAVPARTSPLEQGLRHVGRCLVDGMDVLIATDTNFSAQLLHVSKGRAATDLANLLGVPTIAEVPNVDDTVVVYLDVWERLVTPDEEPDLVHSGLGVESSARLKREWVVRARVGSSVPTPNDPNDPNDPDNPNRFIAGHSYYALATITHKRDKPITDEAITDQREQRLLLPPATLLEDVFGLVDYRRGQGRPLVNLREAINTLLRGGLPMAPELLLTTRVNTIEPTHSWFLKDSYGDIWVFWDLSVSERHRDMWYQHYSQARGSWEPEDLRLPTTPGARYDLFPIVDGAGDIWVFGTIDPAGAENRHIWYQHYSQATGEWEDAERRLSTTSRSATEVRPVVDRAGDIWLFWSVTPTEDEWGEVWYQHYSQATGEWEDAERRLSTTTGYVTGVLPVVDRAGDIWLFWSVAPAPTAQSTESWYQHYSQTTGEWEDAERRLTTITESFTGLVAVVEAAGDIWLFTAYESLDDLGENVRINIWYRHDIQEGGLGQELHLTQITIPELNRWEFHLNAVVDRAGDIWLFWNLIGVSEGDSNIRYQHYSQAESRWERTALSVPTTHQSNGYPYPFALLADQAGDIWLFWNSGGNNTWYQRYSQAGGGWEPAERRLPRASTGYTPFALEDSAGAIWVFWFGVGSETYGFWYRKIFPAI